MSSGWVKLHRKLIDNPIFKNDKLFRVFMYCLLKATHKEHDQLIGDSVVHLKSGQLATGRNAISNATGLTPQNVKTAISKLKTLGILTSKPTNKYSIITMTNWDLHQQDNQQATNKQPTSNQQVTTNKNVKNEKNVKEIYSNEFEAFWLGYPKKTKKPAAQRSFNAAIRKMENPDGFIEFAINDCSIRFKDRDKKYIPDATTYLNNFMWEDEICN